MYDLTCVLFSVFLSYWNKFITFLSVWLWEDSSSETDADTLKQKLTFYKIYFCKGNSYSYSFDYKG